MFPIPVTLSVAESVQEYTMSATESVQNFAMNIETEIVTSLHPDYTGAVTVTPTNRTQVLSTKDTVVLDNITINPIPNNYGLITWNGSTITVS